MNMTYLDTDTHELIAIIDNPTSDTIEVSAAERFSAGLFPHAGNMKGENGNGN